MSEKEIGARWEVTSPDPRVQARREIFAAEDGLRSIAKRLVRSSHEMLAGHRSVRAVEDELVLLEQRYQQMRAAVIGATAVIGGNQKER